MADTMKLPGLGNVKKTYVYVAGAGVAGFVIYAYWSRSQATASNAGTETTYEDEYLPTDSVTTAGAGQFNGGNTQYSSSDTDTGTGTGTISTNEAWVEQAVTVLLNAGWDSGVAYQAIYAYLGKQSLTQEQQRAIRWVLGVIGKPPVGSFAIVTETPGQPTGDPPGTGNQAPSAPTGLSIKSIGEKDVTLQWNAVAGATSYNIYLGSAKIYNKTSPSLYINALKGNTSYGPYTVTALNAAGESAKSSGLTIKTKPAPTTPTAPSTGVPAHYTYTVIRNDNLSNIAAKTNKQYGLKNTWQSIYNFNLKYRSSATAAKIRQRGPNLTYAGSTWWIPK